MGICDGICKGNSEGKNKPISQNLQPSETNENEFHKNIKEKELKEKFKNSYEKQLKGLINNGGESYINAVLQSLSNTNKLSKYFISEYEQNDSNKKISNEYYKLLINLGVKEKQNSSEDFKKLINEELQGSQQKSFQNLLNFLLEGMHKELNEVNRNNLDNENISLNSLILFQELDSVLGKNKIENKFKTNFNSIISKLFYGIKERKYSCHICKETKYDYEAFYFVELQLDQIINKRSFRYTSDSISINQCFDYYKNEEFKERKDILKCKNCQNKCLSISNSFLYIPNYLIIIINRGKNDPNYLTITFDIIIDLTKYIINNQDKNVDVRNKYQLYSVVSQVGNKGHFVAYCKHLKNKKWYIYNDTKVEECEENEYLKEIPYILFYELVESNN